MMGIKLEVDLPSGVMGELLDSKIMDSRNGRYRIDVDNVKCYGESQRHFFFYK